MIIGIKLFKIAKIRWPGVRYHNAATIFNLSSGYGKCGVSVIRVSGPQTKQAIQTILGKQTKLVERHAYLKSFFHPKSGEMIDRGLILWFPGPASFTGEDCCEFQLHGSIAVVASMLDALKEIPGLRVSTPGEFTKRAFFNGKMDLTEVEGLADLIQAETESQRKQALLQSTGVLSNLYTNWRTRLIQCSAHLEAYIDFGEDENIESNIITNLKDELLCITAEIQSHLNDQRQGELIRHGVRTAIIGAPNVGKSSFLNLICQRKISIVAPSAGTTRDIIETMHNFAGYPVVFSDTAGLRSSTDDLIELEGIARTKECVLNTDLILLLIDAQRLIQQNIETKNDLHTYVQSYLHEIDIKNEDLKDKKVQLIINKIDLLSKNKLKFLQKLEDVLLISCKTEENLSHFLNNFQQLLKNICGSPHAENPRITQSRYRQQLENCINHIHFFLTEFFPKENVDIAISAEKLRNSLKCIERITGHVSSDDILNVIFKDFCIGK